MPLLVMSYRLLVIGHKHRAWSTEHREKELMADKQEWLLVIRYWLLEREQRNSCSIYHRSFIISLTQPNGGRPLANQ